jgi:hypothetical protein
LSVIRDGRAIVTHVAPAVVVGIGLIGIRRGGAIVALVPNAVAVLISLIGIRGLRAIVTGIATPSPSEWAWSAFARPRSYRRRPGFRRRRYREE